ncbi:cytosolic regulator Pianissimo [Apiospora sp. TS-2023a]
MLSTSATPTQKSLAPPLPGTSAASSVATGRPSLDRDGLQPPSTNGGRTIAGSAARGGTSFNATPAPGSFSSDLRSQLTASRAGSRADGYNLDKLEEDGISIADQTINTLKEALGREMKIKEGSENLLEALNIKKAKQTKEQRTRVEAELNSSNLRIKDLRQKLADAQRQKASPVTPTRTRNEGLLQNNGVRSPPSASRSGAGSDYEDITEQSPSFALAEILQALEVEGLTPEYYVGRANSLVDLFKRYPTLNREVVAAGYRMIRYAISDVSSLKKIRSLNTDYMVVVSLAKDRKADVEREQALKFIRAFLDVKDGIREISRAVVRTIASVAEHPDDRLRPICIETLAEILLRDPALLVACGGISPLSEALSEGTYKSPESLASALLYLLDAPKHANIFGRDTNSRAIGSLVSSLIIPNPALRETVIDLLFSLLRIKPPAWATSFLAGRRLTTYGRVATLKSTTVAKGDSMYEDEGAEQNFVEHYTALLLAILVKAGMMPNLLQVAQDNGNPPLKRKTTLLIGEVLKLASRLLPPEWSSELQLLPELFSAAVEFKQDNRFNATGVVYQISSVSRTLYRSSPTNFSQGNMSLSSINEQHGSVEDGPKNNTSLNTDDATFRQLLIDSGVLGSSNPLKWNWDVVLRIIEGPLTNGKRLEEAIKASKFVKRVMSFYRPFKYRFSAYRSTRTTQKYVRVGCALMHTLMQTPEGSRYLADNKLLRQIAECMAQCDPTSGLTAQYPMFAKDNLTDTLCSGYFPMLGVLSGDTKGLQLLERWRIFNMMYHIVDLKQRPDLIKVLLTNFDYSLQGHPRVLLSKALTAGTKDMRIHATNVLRKYAIKQRVTPSGQIVSDSKWAIQLLVTQLYDPEVEVCATAVKILEKACNSKHLLEYIVECRPALDHLGEIGAPLLLRFLSTSIGYHYLDGLDYISNEMDDWFLGRNDSYVSLIETSLARSFLENPDDQPHRLSIYEDEMEADHDSHVPPHFYRELTRTKEGCRLLEDKGHFEEFASIIRDYGMQTEDPETLTKVKGCMWAVGNVGSMELGAPFLESTDVVEHIVKIAETHEVMSLRGTAFFVLGLISRSVHGLEILSELGWDSNTSPLGTSLGFCLPKDLSKFLSFVPWKHETASSVVLPDTQKTIVQSPPAVMKDPDETNQRVLELMIELGNMVMYKKAKQELFTLRQKKIPGFRQPALFKRVYSLLENHHYRLGDRHMIIELFDKSVLRNIVYGDESEDEVESSSSGDEQKTERQRSISDPAELEKDFIATQKFSI